MHSGTLASLSAIAFLGASCAPVANSAFLSSTSAIANDHIMLVRQTPPTFGFQRLSALSVRHPDLGLFTARQGTPDYLAETKMGQDRYLIIYYLGQRRAFACRTVTRSSDQIEFSGPHPITVSEIRTLSKLR